MAAEHPAKDPGLSWSQLRAFDASARLLSFNAAAASLNLTPAAVRYQVGLLEARLGVRLYDRQGGRLALTAAGASFRGRIARPMQELAKACADASQSASAAPLLLTAPPLFARQYLFGNRFLRWCDANDIRLEVTDSKRDLFGRDQIVAIRLGTGGKTAVGGRASTRHGSTRHRGRMVVETKPADAKRQRGRLGKSLASARPQQKGDAAASPVLVLCRSP